MEYDHSEVLNNIRSNIENILYEKGKRKLPWLAKRMNTSYVLLRRQIYLNQTISLNVLLQIASSLDVDIGDLLKDNKDHGKIKKI